MPTLIDIDTLLNWEGWTLCLGRLTVGCVHHRRDGDWQAREPYIEGQTVFETESEARAAVESAVRSALSV